MDAISVAGSIQSICAMDPYTLSTGICTGGGEGFKEDVATEIKLLEYIILCTCRLGACCFFQGAFLKTNPAAYI